LHEKDPSKTMSFCHTKHETNWDGKTGHQWTHKHVEFDIRLGGTFGRVPRQVHRDNNLILFLGYEIYTARHGTFNLSLGDGGYLN
ncbi:hypothetical protein C8J56DRAFT_727880, partial [Mycena floridula]